MFTATYVIPAYGRVYKTLEAAKADWDSGKDFKVYTGPYCSKRDFNPLDSVYVYLEGSPQPGALQ